MAEKYLAAKLAVGAGLGGQIVKNGHVVWLCSVVQVEGRYEDVSEFCESLYAENVRSPYLLAFMIDILENRLETKQCEDVPQTLQWAVEVLTSYHLIFLLLFASVCNQPTRLTHPCIPPGSPNQVPALVGCSKGGDVTSALLGGS